LSPKAFDLLEALALERPKLLTKAVLQQRLWPNTFVSEGNLTNLVAEIRDALDDPPRDPAYIRTAHKFGYAF
jgi:DNA-binding winged helix-turn-helix (wHTH) protein